MTSGARDRYFDIQILQINVIEARERAARRENVVSRAGVWRAVDQSRDFCFCVLLRERVARNFFKTWHPVRIFKYKNKRGLKTATRSNDF